MTAKTATVLMPDTKLQRTEDWLSTVSNGAVIMMHGANGRFVALNETGSRIWALLETPLTVKDIGARLAEEFEISPEQAVADMTPLVNLLLDNGAIARAPA
ncbi:MAG TPA: PqqD family protein [Rhizomicrobium sp.]|jgi:hypothetical protein|nr:PqqD family protein [Rhizomicrobium sp.]